MTKTYGSITFINTEKFEDFLNENMKQFFDLNACYDDLELAVNSGSNSYELKSYETKSGRPETIDFHRVDTEVEEDVWETIIQF